MPLLDSLKKKFSKKAGSPKPSPTFLKSPYSPSESQRSNAREAMASYNPYSRTNSASTSNSPVESSNEPYASNNPFASTGEEAPPVYTAVPQVPHIDISETRPASHSPFVVSTADDPFAFLATFDTLFLIDDSGSMAGGLWRETGEALQAITPVCTQHDADGIDIHFLNQRDNPHYHNVTRPAAVQEIFQTVRPSGATPTGQRLNGILKPYLTRLELSPQTTKPINIICITDGEPTDDVESVLIAAAKKLDRLDAPAWQVGVQFFQVGRDERAKQHLKDLDDNLAEIAGTELRDIVDTVPFTGAQGTRLSGDGILKVVLGAVNRRLDRKKSQDLHR